MKKKITGLILLAVGLAICIFAGYKIIDINREYKFSRELYSREKDRYFISESNKSILEKYN